MARINLNKLIEQVQSDTKLLVIRDEQNQHVIKIEDLLQSPEIVTLIQSLVAAGTVLSVNTQTGIVVLDADDIDDTSTLHKFVTADDLTTLSNTSGTNTGDQDISGIAANASAISTNVTAISLNTAKVSAHGSVTTHSDVTNAGSGQIITADERTAIATSVVIISLGAIDADLEVDTNIDYFDAPFAGTLTSVEASVETAPTGSVATFDVDKNGTTMLSTKITIDAAADTSIGATTPPVISVSSFAKGDRISVAVDGIGSTVAGAGGKIYLYLTETI